MGRNHHAGTDIVAVVNVGNTCVNMGFCNLRAHLPPLDSAGLPENRLPDLLEPMQFDHAHLASVVENLERFGCETTVLVSVVPEATAFLADAVPGLVVLDHRWSMPFPWGEVDLSRVGTDRLANMAMARAWGLEEALVVDAGTATTFDLLAKGVFQGGLIAPGMAFAAQKLGELAAQLTPVPFAACPLEVGTDTRSAMAAGAWHTGTLGVAATIEMLMQVYGSRPVVVTGGLGPFLMKEGYHCDKYWTLRGAAWLWERQQTPK